MSELEKLRARGVSKAQQALSEHSRKTNDADQFVAYLKAKKEHDKKTLLLPAGKVERLEV